eukprot:Skav226392  [mRNA]  locus=scaffold1631:127113:127721:+ [translate_table: standard]
MATCLRWLVGGPAGSLPQDVQGLCNFARKRPISLRTQEGELPLLRCITDPSDILYLPDGWAHATCGMTNFNVGVGYIGSIGSLPPLHRAAVIGDLQAVEAATSSDLSPAGPGMLNEAGLPPLHWAAWNGHVPLIRKFIELARADRADATREANTTGSLTHALRWAAARGHSSATAFLARQVGPQTRDEEGAELLPTAFLELK